MSGGRQFPSYKVFVFCAKYPFTAGEIWRMKALGHYQPKSTHTINNHYSCTVYCLAPSARLALLFASQLYTCLLPHSLQPMQLLGRLLKTTYTAEIIFYLLNHQETSRAKKTPTIKWLSQGLNVFFSPLLTWVFAFFWYTNRTALIILAVALPGPLPYGKKWSRWAQAHLPVAAWGRTGEKDRSDSDRGNRGPIIAIFRLFSEHNWIRLSAFNSEAWYLQSFKLPELRGGGE